MSGQDLSRADPVLRYLLMRPPGVVAPPTLAPDRPTRPVGLLDATIDREPGQIWVRTLVRVGAGGEAALRRAGAELRTRAGDIVTARVPLEAVPGLLEAAGIRAMEAAVPLVPLGFAGTAAAPTDTAMADADFDGLRRRVGSSWEGLTGDGVIIGVYDSGLDLTHGDFLRPGGTTRVIFAWDQTGSQTPAPGAMGGHTFDYGAECTGAIIDAGGCGMVDRVGHGTHVTGVAAADGSATGQDQPAWRFAGGAPDADLVIVKGGDGQYTADRVLDGVAYIVARAEALRRPVVVNLSLSSQSGPHDGTTLFERALDALTGPGRIIVAGAGNAGDHRNTTPVAPNGPFHAQGTGAGSHAVRVPPYEPAPGAINDGVLVELWYGGTDSLSITVTSPAGESLTVATGDSASLDTDGGAIAIMNALDGPSPLNGDHGALIGIVDAREAAPPDSGDWAIQVSADAVNGTGVYHLWLTGATFEALVPTVLDGGTTNRYLVGVPGSADRVIAAGAHVTRHRWLGVGGDVEAFQLQEPLGAIAFFSSPGPRRDGVSKPDLTAPGKMVIAARSKDAALWDDFPDLLEADSVHAALLGTSMASPGVAAAAALLLQIDPGLEPEDIRDALRLSAAVDPFVATPTPHPVWGAGKLDAAAATERLAPDGLAAGEAVNLSANPVRGDALVINYRDPPESVAVYTLVGERVRSFSAGELGPLNVVWPLDTDAGGEVANGVYVLVVELPGSRVVRKILVARP